MSEIVIFDEFLALKALHDENNKDSDCDCINGFYEISDSDFYPPEDDRLYSSGIDDVDGGDSFDEYAKWFWDEYECEIYD